MIASLIDAILVAAAIILLVMASVLFLQVFSCLTRRPSQSWALSDRRPSTAVIVPAHNEEQGVAAIVTHLRSQLFPGDRLIVIADNCIDATARLAREAGAEVVTRNDQGLKGKGYALAAGVHHLAKAPTETVVFIDADSRFSDNGVEWLARACLASGQPVQCLNLMVNPPGQTQGSRLAEFAWRIKNDLRPGGYARLGAPCHLLGTGMALPWHLLEKLRLATGHVTEDLMIGIECATRGYPPRFLEKVEVSSTFPHAEAAGQQQKSRWMHGHISLIASHAPPLLLQGFLARDLRLVAMALDLMVPPLVLLAFGSASLLIASLGLWLVSGLWSALLLSLGINLVLFVTLFEAWMLRGRELIGVSELADVPRHVANVLRIGLSFARGRRSEWVRADRTSN